MKGASKILETPEIRLSRKSFEETKKFSPAFPQRLWELGEGPNRVPQDAIGLRKQNAGSRTLARGSTVFRGNTGRFVRFAICLLVFAKLKNLCFAYIGPEKVIDMSKTPEMRKRFLRFFLSIPLFTAATHRFLVSTPSGARTIGAPAVTLCSPTL